MNSFSFFSMAVIALGISRSLPQLIRLLRTRQAHGVSVDTAATSMMVSLGWTIYGVLTQQPAISLASIATATTSALIAIFALRFGRQFREIMIAPIWMVLLLLMGVLGGASGLSIILPVSVLASNIPQIRVAFKEQNLADLSLAMWLLAFCEGLLWGGYGIIKHDLPVLLNNGFLLTTSAVIIFLKIMHMRTVKGLRPDTAPRPSR